jgi:hypothetical protein
MRRNILETIKRVCRHSAPRNDHSHSRGTRGRRLLCEMLEDRRLLSSVTLYPTKDTYISQAEPAVAKGSESLLWVDATASQAKQALLDFDLSGIPAGSTINSVELKVFSTSTGDRTIVLKSVNSPTWSEGTATWDALQSLNVTEMGSVTTTGWFDFDSSVAAFAGLKSIVQQRINNSGQQYGFLLSDGGADSASFYSREAASGGHQSEVPTLIVDYTINSPTVTTNPTNVTTDVGAGPVTFTAAATGTPSPTVKWQVDTGSGFTDLGNDSFYSGETTTTLTVTGATVAMNGYKYRAVFTNGIAPDGTTTAATLTVNPALGMTPATLPSGVPTAAYHQTITVTGGTTPYTSLVVSNFAAGGTGLTSSDIVANATSGTIVINGTPTAVGTLSFTVTVIDTVNVQLVRDYTVTIDQPPTVTASPTSVTTDVGLAAVTFTAAASGTPAPTVKWQADTGSGFADISNGGVYSGATTGTLTVTGATLAMNGYKYRAVFTNGVAPDATSGEATLTVNPALSITPDTLPSGKANEAYQQTITIAGGTTPYTTFKVENFNAGGTGLGAPNIVGSTVVVSGTPTSVGSATFTVVIVDPAGGSITQNYTVAINQPPAVTANPADVTTDVGLAAVTFTAAASGTPAPTVKWQVDAGSGFTDLANGGVYSGVTTATLTVTGATVGMTGYKYRAVFTNGVAPDATTTAATLTVNPAVAVTPSTLPSGVVNTAFHQTITVTGGTTPYTTFTVTDFNAGGTGLTSGQIVVNAATKTVVIDGTPTHVGTATFKLTVIDTVGGTVVQDYSLAVNEPPTVTASPANVTTNVGLAAVTFTAAASGTPTPTVKWQVDAGSGFADLGNGGAYSGVTTTTLTITGATAAMNGYKYRAVFTNGIAPDATTTAATLTVNPALEVTVTTLPAAVANLLYHQTITVFGGTSPYTTFKIENFNAGGTGLTAQQIVADASKGTVVINGTPAASGTASFTLSVVDSIGATISRDYTIAVNMRPSVSLVTPTGTQSGDITIGYTLIDQESNTCSVQVYYSLDGDTWHTATRGGAGDGTSGLTSGPTGVDHTFVWASAKDIVDKDAAKVLIYIVPSDASGTGTAATSGEFAVANYISQRPAAFVETPVGTQTGVVTIKYSLSDKESDLCSIVVEYSPNGGATWYTATKAAGGEGTTNLTSGVSGANHTFLWDSGHDLANVSSSNVVLRIRPSDAVGEGTAGMSLAFTVDNFVNYDPSVSITNLVTMADGSIIVTYDLADGNSDVCNVLVRFYSKGVWRYASVAMGQGDGTTNLASSPDGVSHVFVWASGSDLPGSTNTNVRLSIVPYDGDGAGMGGTTDTFTVTNHKNYYAPAINRVGVSETSGARNGRLETDEKLTITWAASSPYRIVSQSITIDGRTYTRISGPYNGVYYSCNIGKLGAGVHNYAIGATNSKGLSFSNRGSFTVEAILPPLVDRVAVANGTITWVASSWHGIVSQTLSIDGRKVGSVNGPANSFYYYSYIGRRSVGTHTYTIKATDGKHLTTTKTGTFQIPATLLVGAATAPQESAAALSGAELTPIVAEAICRLETQFGSRAETVLAGLQVKVADLPSGVLGEALDHTILIDRDAAGYGWFVDPTPSDDAEFVAAGRSSLSARKDTAADQRADLLTTIMHEMGHLLGCADTVADELMGAVLPLGVRRQDGNIA